MGKEQSRRVSLIADMVHGAARLGSVSFGGQYGRHGPLEPWPGETWIRTSQLDVHALTWGDPTGLTKRGTAQGGTQPCHTPHDADLEPLFLLHGLGSNPWVWGEVGALLSGNRHVVALGMPGHGRTHYDGPFDTLAIATHLLETIDAVTGGSIVLMGHSWGGKVAAVTAGLLGHRCKRLVLADPAPPKGMNSLVRRLPSLANAVFEPERGPFPDHASMQRSLRKLLYLHRWGALEQRIALESFRQESDGSWHAVLSNRAFNEILHNCLFEDTSGFLTHITCPVLLLRPTYSLSFLPGELAELRNQKFVLTQQRIHGDHDFNVTNPADTVDAVSRWLATS